MCSYQHLCNIQRQKKINLFINSHVFQWIPPPPPEKVRDAEEQITIDLGDEYEQALTSATQEEIIDLAGDFLNYYFSCIQSQFHMLFLCHFSLT